MYDFIQRTSHMLHVIKEIGGELLDVVHDIHTIITQRQGNFIVTCIALVGPVVAVLKTLLDRYVIKLQNFFKVYDNNNYGNIK